MKRLFSLLWLLLFNFFLIAQDIEYLGLSDLHITSLKIGYRVIAVGSDYNGVYWLQFSEINDSGWNKIGIDSVHVSAVYPHKSGPLGWAIGIGAEPTSDNSEFIYCSFLGGSPKPMSYGIDTNYTTLISGIDGFPDPTICGETFAIGGRKLYRRFFQDTVWHSIYDLTIEGNFASLKAREDNQYVYAGGAEGFAGILLIRSSDKGNTWENLFPLCNVQDLDFYGDSIHKIIVSDHFKIMLSVDDGENWTEIFKSDSLGIQNISFSLGGKIIYAITNTLFYSLPRTYFFFSSNSGESWESIQLPIYDLVVDMDIGFDDFIYFASISSGVFRLKLPVVGIEDESENILPEGYILYQNYPNPFNPTTKIRYAIPSNQGLVNLGGAGGGLVTLKVYDVLGNEIATLVDEYKPAGNYEVEFNSVETNRGVSLPSGVYFYQLKVGSLKGLAFMQTKKMILIR